MKRRPTTTIGSTMKPRRSLTQEGNMTAQSLRVRFMEPEASSIFENPSSRRVSNIAVTTRTTASTTTTHTHDRYNYALLIALYTLQGIPLGLSASIPFLIQQKLSSAQTHALSPLAYQAQAIFSFCTWPFSIKLLWAPLVDSIYFPKFGRRKSWLIPIQCFAGLWMILGSRFLEDQLGTTNRAPFNIVAVTIYFFILYFLMATQDISVDGWAITMLSKQNRGMGPVCNSIGQNLGYLIAYVGFIALNDVEMSERVWRPWLGFKGDPTRGLVTLGGFLQGMGWVMLLMTLVIALFKREGQVVENSTKQDITNKKMENVQDLTSTLGVRETYQQLWAICQLPAVRQLFLILLTYRFPTSLSDNVKMLKAMEFGLSKQTIAWLTPLILLPLAIVVPILATKTLPFHSYPLTPLQQFLFAYKIRVSVVPLVDMWMLWIVRQRFQDGIASPILLWLAILFSTALQAFVHNLQSNAQMSFFAQRVDPAIGGTYMTLLNTAANLGGTWPASFIMYLLGQWTFLTRNTSMMDAYFPLQTILCFLGLVWLWRMGHVVENVELLPNEAWRTPEVETDEEKDENKKNKCCIHG